MSTTHGQSFLDAPIVSQTLSSFKSTFTPDKTAHRTLTLSNWRSIIAMDSARDKAKTISKQGDVFKGAHMQPPIEDMRRTFRDVNAFKRDMQPNSSGVDYRNFLSTITSNKRSYDSNISNTLEHNRRVVAYKSKEQGLRAAALKVNVVHGSVQKNTLRSLDLKQDVDTQALTGVKSKFDYESPNYNRSAHYNVRLIPKNHSLIRIFIDLSDFFCA